MIKNLIFCSLLCVAALADNDQNIVTGADGKQYKLVKPESKLPTGAKEIAEYVRIGDKETVRYGMNLAPKGVAPTFWKIQG
jgi:hypothetical protein